MSIFGLHVSVVKLFLTLASALGEQIDDTTLRPAVLAEDIDVDEDVEVTDRDETLVGQFL